jgi:hypothetical protein
MATTKLTDDLDIIQALGDKPNQSDGLSAAQMKAKYDEGTNLIKTYINDTLTAEIDTNLATKTELTAAVLSGISDDSITTAKCATEQKRGVANGVASLDATANVPLTQLTLLGLLANLTTTDKTNLVTAINEVLASLTTHKTSTDHDGRYYTESELNAGQLDSRYYTETESDNTFVPKSLADAQGDLFYASANDTWARLAKAANDGAILTQASNIPAWLAKGTAGQVLAMNSGATAPEWQSGFGKSASGTYTGDGTTFREINIGFSAKVIFLWWTGVGGYYNFTIGGSTSTSNGLALLSGATPQAQNGSLSYVAVSSTNGFQVSGTSSANENNLSGKTYYYTAIG